MSRRADVRTPLPPDQASPVGAPLPGPGTAGSEPFPVRTATLAKPPVRKLAKDLGVDLELITGSGAGGRDRPRGRGAAVDLAPELVEGSE